MSPALAGRFSTTAPPGKPILYLFNDDGGEDGGMGMEDTQLVNKRKFVCPMDSEAKQYRNIRVWSRERFIAGPCKEMGGLCPANPELLEGFQQSTFKGKVREGHG